MLQIADTCCFALSVAGLEKLREAIPLKGLVKISIFLRTQLTYCSIRTHNEYLSPRGISP